MGKRLKTSFIGRHKIALSGLSAIIIMSLGSLIFGFWSSNGPGGSTLQIIRSGRHDLQYSSSNTGYDGVTANFVNDYIEAKFHNSGRNDVGYNSPHAQPVSTIKSQGATFTLGLATNIKNAYASTSPSFDPLICSTQPPSSVRYINRTYNRPGNASVIAAFGYGSAEPANLVRYTLDLDISKSKEGDWKVSDIQCLSLEAQTSKPYVGQYDAPSYDQRNDRTF